MRAFIALAAFTAVIGASQAFAEPNDIDNAPVTLHFDEAYLKRISAALAKQGPKQSEQQAAQTPAPPPVTAANGKEDHLTVLFGVEFNRYNKEQVSTSALKQYPNNVGWSPEVKWSPFTTFINEGDNYLTKTAKRARVVVSATFNSTAAAGFTAFDHWDTFQNTIDDREEYKNVCRGSYHGYTYDLGNCYYCGNNGYHGTQYCYDTYTAQYAQADGQEATFVQGGTAIQFELPFHFANWIIAGKGGLNITFLGTGVVEDQLRTTTKFAPVVGGSVTRRLSNRLEVEGDFQYGGVRGVGVQTWQGSARLGWTWLQNERTNK